MNLSLRTWLWISYGMALILPVGLYFTFSMPQSGRASSAQKELVNRTMRIQERTALVDEVVQKIRKATPPPPPPAVACLEQVAAVRVPGVHLLALAPDPEAAPPRLRVLAQGKYRELAGYLESLTAFPFPVRVSEMDLSPLPEGELSLSAVVEVGS